MFLSAHIVLDPYPVAIGGLPSEAAHTCTLGTDGGNVAVMMVMIAWGSLGTILELLRDDLSIQYGLEKPGKSLLRLALRVQEPFGTAS